jgi:cysteine desulfuration protein SufE
MAGGARTDDLPDRMAGIVREFQELDQGQRLELLLDFSRDLPPLPQRYAEHPELLEPVPECQSPVFVAAEVEAAPDPLDGTVHVFFQAPREAPTTRGFAGILAEGVDGLSVRDVVDLPDDVCSRLGLSEAVSPLRLRGMVGMLGRIKRQVAEKAVSS